MVGIWIDSKICTEFKSSFPISALGYFFASLSSFSCFNFNTFLFSFSFPALQKRRKRKKASFDMYVSQLSFSNFYENLF